MKSSRKTRFGSKRTFLLERPVLQLHYTLRPNNANTEICVESLALGFNNTSPLFWAAYQNNLEVAGPQGILGLLANYSLDALILPTDFSPGLPAMIGTPVVTVPLGFYPANETVVRNMRGTLIETGPNIP